MKRLLLHLESAAKGLLFISVMLASSAAFGQVSLVKDINFRSYDFYDLYISEMTMFNGNVYFSINGELWRSDGTYEGTGVIKQFQNITEIIASDNYLFVAASDDSVGAELWKSDGTSEGTILLKDINPGTTSSSPSSLTEVNSIVYFVANDGKTGKELWRTDGSGSGTHIVKDILKVAGSSNPQNLIAFNDHLYFTANDGATGYELWRTNGTANGTELVVDINPVYKRSSSPDQLVATDHELFFVADDGTNNKQLWKSDGSAGNASLVKIINATSSTAIKHLTAVNNLVMFQANDGIHGTELWRSDGTSDGTYLLADITPGPGSETQYATPHLDHFRVSNGKLYFLAVNDGQNLWTTDGTINGTFRITHWENVNFPWIDHHCTAYGSTTIFGGSGYNGFEVWKTDGTVQGTSRVKETFGDPFYNSMMPTEASGFLFFIDSGSLWKTDGTEEGTTLVRSFFQPTSSMPQYLTDVNGTIFFQATDNGYNLTLWRTDGSESGTIKLHEYLDRSANITAIGNDVYFSGRDFKGMEPWKSNGTAEGTHLISNIAPEEWPQEKDSNPQYFTSFNDAVFFSAIAPNQNSASLWRTNGTSGTTTQILPDNNQPFWNPRDLTKAGNKLYFVADSYLGTELFVTDGTNAGTSITKDIKLHYRGSSPIRLTSFNNVLYFQADNGGNGYELYRSDGTKAGTYIVKDIRREDLGSGEQLAPVDMGNMVTTDQALYFTALRPSGKNALWKSDGTAAGTLPVKEFPGQPSSEIIAVNGNEITIALSYGDYMEIWISNGTAAGTQKVTTIGELKSLFYPVVTASKQGVTYFLAYDGVTNKIWRTDGTDQGTYEINFDGYPYDLETSGNRVYLSGQTDRYGWELFTIEDNMPSERIASSSMVESFETSPEEVSESFGYPNPFNNHFTLNVPGDEDKSFNMKVFTIDGKPHLEARNLKFNVDHQFGVQWNAGLYLMQVQTEKGIVTQKLLKKN